MRELAGLVIKLFVASFIILIMFKMIRSPLKALVILIIFTLLTYVILPGVVYLWSEFHDRRLRNKIGKINSLVSSIKGNLNRIENEYNKLIQKEE